ncbi:MAG: hypothetical protein RMJ89_07125 [Flammeovirgaceae bacterium]|nr:hypothetical protein [Flammeovirgaceae bacterium]
MRKIFAFFLVLILVSFRQISVYRVEKTVQKDNTPVIVALKFINSYVE